MVTDSGKKVVLKGKANCPLNDFGMCSMEFSNFFIPRGKYDVIDTDYKSFAIVHSCGHKLEVFKYDWVWILTRNPLVPNSPKWNEMASKMSSIIQTKFKVDKDSSRKVYTDF
mmetsp:Transcript_9615/g.16146  ORF Transcript_9615/g.16146 Transcript_9615/m.16146 type:complete len:112 (-) Transcript_9615:35-370(-)